MRYCQGNMCHQYRTKDRIRGTKGSKYYGTRRRSNFYYGKNNFCSMQCMNDWLDKNIEYALNHFGRITESKKVMASGAWYKDYDWRGGGDIHYLKNYLLGEKIPITERQYRDDNIITPNNLSQ